LQHNNIVDRISTNTTVVCQTAPILDGLMDLVARQQVMWWLDTSCGWSLQAAQSDTIQQAKDDGKKKKTSASAVVGKVWYRRNL